MSEYLPSGHGFIHVITGPMYSSKTLMLIAQLKKEAIAGKKIMVFKPNIDDRYATDEIVTHDGENLRANNIPCETSQSILEHIHNSVDVVGIDEAQFFDEGLVEVVQTLADRGLRVIVAGVDMDYRCNPFKPMNDIMAIAEIVQKQTAVCSDCGRPATKIQRFTNGKLSHWNEPTVAVGSNIAGQEFQYEAKCRKCYKTPPKIIN